MPQYSQPSEQPSYCPLTGNPNDSTQQQTGVNNYINSGKEVLSISPTLIIPLNTNGDRPFKVRTLLDSGSGTNWIVKNILQHVQHTVKGTELMEVHTFHGAVRKRYPLVEIYYQDTQKLTQSIMCYVHDAYVRHIHLNLTGYIQSKYNTSDPFWINKLADPGDPRVDHGFESQGVGMVLSPATTNKLCTAHAIIQLHDINMLLEPTIFGVAISGAIPEHLRNRAHQVSVSCTVPQMVNNTKDHMLFSEGNEVSLLDDIQFLWKQEQIGIQPVEENVDHTKAWDLFLESISRDSVTGQYTVRLPYNEKKHLISDNIPKAAARTYRQQELMLKNKAYGEAVVGAKNDMATNDYIEKVDMSQPVGEVVYYMPFRGIIKTSSDTTKCRLVMDASSKPSRTHVSLNQALYQGPNLIIELSFLLLRFMLGMFATIADIEKAFLRIIIAPCDRDALRFFWFVDPWDPGSQLITYRFKAVMFGSAASPFQLAAVLTVLIRDECNNRQVQQALQNRIYVDDVTFSHNLQSTMLDFFLVATETLQKGTFNLRQWASNSPQLMEKARERGVANNSRIVKVLGMVWDINEDTLGYNTEVSWDNLFTKRSALRFCNQIFDPLGWLSPILIRLRLFIQKLWQEQLPWDKSFELVQDFKETWLNLVKQAQLAIKSKLNRKAVWTENTEIHIFSDASKEAYGSVVYLRTPPCPQYPKGDVHLACSKSKVKPIDGKQTIPRLELSGLVVAAHQVKYLTKAWDLPNNANFHIWCDAKVVLHWMEKQNIKETFINNRVDQVKDLCADHWESIKLHYVPTDLNPADIITRQQKAEEFINNETWWKGPTWLLNKSDWPTTDHSYSMYPDGKPIKKNTKVLATTNRPLITSILPFFAQGNFHSNMRTTAYTLRAFLNPPYPRICKSNAITFHRDVVHKDELINAKSVAIRIMQRESFPRQLALLRGGKPIKGPLKKLNLYIDNIGIIRCRHRLENLPGNELHPMLAHGQHPFTIGYIRCKHIHTNCSSRQHTLQDIRKDIEGPKLTTAIKKVIWDCDLCRILRARPYAYPQQPPLPRERLICQRPFAVCGIDYSGPHYVKQGRSSLKVWIALFTCMVSRAVHLEIVPDLSSKTFLQVLQTMSWKKTPPKVLLTDNATCFVGANRLLKEISQQNETVTGLAMKGIEWNFTPARAPWFGAVYERLIGVLKKELTKLVGQTALTYHELSFTLAQVEGVINNRPLVQVGDTTVITPNNILTGRNDNYDDMLEVLDCKEILLSASKVKNDLPRLYQDTERRLAKFWQLFQQQYLENIKFSPDTTKNKGGGLTPQIGDLVIIHSHDPRLKWRKAIVLEKIPSEDGLVRKCKLRTSTGEMVRATKHIYPLEINVEKFTDEIRNQNNAENNDFEGFDDFSLPRDDKARKLKEFVSNLPSDAN